MRKLIFFNFLKKIILTLLYGVYPHIALWTIIIPFWINELLRSFALRILFANEGVINNFLTGIGVIDQSILFITYDIGLYTGLVYAYILLMMFPLYNAIESLDINQIEAAKDLGSSSLRTHWRIVIPHAKPGIVSGCTMVFMLTVGALATPVVLSSPNTLWFPQLIYQWFNMNDNWSRGSAYSIILLIISVIFVLAMMRIFKVKIGEIIKWNQHTLLISWWACISLYFLPIYLVHWS